MSEIAKNPPFRRNPKVLHCVCLFVLLNVAFEQTVVRYLLHIKIFTQSVCIYETGYLDNTSCSPRMATVYYTLHGGRFILNIISFTYLLVSDCAVIYACCRGVLIPVGEFKEDSLGCIPLSSPWLVVNYWCQLWLQWWYYCKEVRDLRLWIWHISSLTGMVVSLRLHCTLQYVVMLQCTLCNNS